MKIKPGTKFTLCSPDEQGSLDYTTTVILLNSYSSSDRSLIRSALKPSIKKNKLIPAEINAYNLCIHEYTHYLDLHTTLWGLEFLNRRSAALSKVLKQGKSALSVTMLNAAEIMMHEDFNLVLSRVRLQNLVTKHCLTYSEKYGTVIIVHLYINDVLIAETSVSMLSILEANAIANEFEGEYHWISCTKGSVDPQQHCRIEAKYAQLLEDSSRLEYNVIHILVAIHFPAHTLRHRLKLVSTLCQLALDISSLDMSMLANKINDFIKNKYLGDALCNDLCRGMSRQVVVFYLVLWLYGYTQQTEMTTDQVAKYFEGPIHQLLNDMLKSFGIEHPLSQDLSDLEFDNSRKLLRKNRGKFMLPGALRAAAFNRKIRKSQLSTGQAFRRLLLPDIILDDHSKVRPPSRIGANVLHYWDRMYDECSELDEMVRDPDVMKKFHMDPDSFGPMQHRREIHAMQRLQMDYDEI
jgi:hypothetical protein